LSVRLLALLALLTLVSWPAQAERRVALVVGNAAYQHTTPLKNPVLDAQSVTATLRKLDFEVITEVDLDKMAAERALKRFARLAAKADVALFYFSGHAVQRDDQNYLLPVSANIEAAVDITLETVALQDVTNVMKAAGARIQLIFLDACRNNPFADRLAAPTRSALGADRGLARVSATAGSFVAFSTSPGAVAYDGDSQLSPFTASFARRALEPKVELRQVLTKVRSDVVSATGGRQVPWDNSSLMGDFYLVPPRQPPVFDRVAVVSVPRSLAERAPASLKLTPPSQPEGGDLTITVEAAPRSGELWLRDRPVRSGDRLSPAEYSALGYRIATSGASTDAFSFRVQDDWGNQEVGFVTLALEASPAALVAEEAPVDIGRSLTSATSVLGLGPNLKLTGRPSFGSARAEWIRLASAIGKGQLLLGDRPLDQGKAVRLADFTQLAFLPAPGSEGQRIEALFQAEAPATGQVRLDIQVEMHECDRLAGSPLDGQGVSEGVLQGNFKPELARPACEAAVRDHPGVGRFHNQLARVYLAEARNEEARKAYEKAVELGHIRARVGLGYLYAVGAGVGRDEARARAEYEAAAATGDVYALHALGKLYYEGRGVPRDLAKARELYERAARLGHTYAMNALGRMYKLGEGLDRSPELAKRYWQQSAARDDIYGIHNMGFVYLEGIAAEKDPARALGYFKQAAERGHPEAPNSVGRLYLFGIGVPPDPAEAVRWYRMGSDRGDGWSALNLGDLSRQGKGLARDLNTAAASYARAAGAYAVEPARRARAELAALDAAPKTEALRALLRKLEPGAQPPSAQQALLQRASEAAARRGVKPASAALDDVLVAAARADWLSLGTRLDLF